MSLVRLLPAWLHAIADYAAGIALIVVALSVHDTGKAEATGAVIGIVVLVVSLLTRYPLGLVRVLPFRFHSAADYLAAVLLVAAPFALGLTSSDSALTVVYVGVGAAVLLVSLVTNYQYGSKQARVADAEGRAEADKWYHAAVTPALGATALDTADSRGYEAWRDESAGAAAPAPVTKEPAPVTKEPAPVTKEEVLAQMMALQGR